MVNGYPNIQLLYQLLHPPCAPEMTVNYTLNLELRVKFLTLCEEGYFPRPITIVRTSQMDHNSASPLVNITSIT